MLRIISLAPWAYIGFESVSHSVPEFKFQAKRSLSVIGIALLAGALVYSLLTILSASVPVIGQWELDAAKVEALNRVENIPSFYAAISLLGTKGQVLLVCSVLGAVLSSLIGMLVASSRLYAAMAEDGILSKWFAYRNQEGNPSNAILFCAVISCIILVLGRTAIEWVVDITTLGGAIAYGLTSFSAYRIAVQRGDQKERIFGLLGILVSVWFGFTFMFP